MRFEDLSVTEQRDWALGHLHTAHVVIADLNNQLTIRKKKAEAKSIREHFGLTVSESAFVNALYAARGGMVTYDYIRAVVKGCAQHMSVPARRARRALGDESSIKNIRATGYAMSQEWVVRLDALKASWGQS